MVRNLLGRWWRGDVKLSSSRPSRAIRRPTPVRPQLEVLEERAVPAAIRNLSGFTTNSLPREDDSPSQQANVGFNLNFFGVQSNQLFVNNNGNVTFNQALSAFTPTALNTANGGVPIIAAFFADVDTRGIGNGSQVVTYGTDTLCGRNAFGVDYINVGYFGNHTDKLNSFQIILVDRSDVNAGDFDIEFNYDQIKWETGDASGGSNGLGGTSARVGYTNGSGTAGTFSELPGSGTNGAFLDGGSNALINQTLLSSTPGRLHFLVRSGQVILNPPPVTPPVNIDVTGQTRNFYPLRYIFDQDTGTIHGNLTIVNVNTGNVVTTPTSVDACLDITTTTTATTATDNTLIGPINVVYPAGSTGTDTLVNATGSIASGGQYITAPNVPRVPVNTVLRVRVEFANPSLTAPSTFYFGQPIRVFAGAFDPTLL